MLPTLVDISNICSLRLLTAKVGAVHKLNRKLSCGGSACSKWYREGTAGVKPTRSPMQIHDSSKETRAHLGFQILTSLLDPDSSSESSLDSATVRMSERCPGASRPCRMLTSSSLILHT